MQYILFSHEIATTCIPRHNFFVNFMKKSCKFISKPCENILHIFTYYIYIYIYVLHGTVNSNYLYSTLQELTFLGNKNDKYINEM